MCERERGREREREEEDTKEGCHICNDRYFDKMIKQHPFYLGWLFESQCCEYIKSYFLCPHTRTHTLTITTFKPPPANGYEEREIQCEHLNSK